MMADFSDAVIALVFLAFVIFAIAICVLLQFPML